MNSVSGPECASRANPGAPGTESESWHDWWVAAGDDESEWWLDVAPETLQAALTLAQTIWWVDSEGTPHLVDAMSTAHRRAVIDFLVLRARELLLSVQETRLRAREGSASSRAAASLLIGAATLSEHDRWLESTPLMRRLRQLTQGPSALGTR
jgi:hypothetical protein